MGVCVVCARGKWRWTGLYGRLQKGVGFTFAASVSAEWVLCFWMCIWQLRKREETTDMYGKIFEKMFTGSMMGTGALSFAVWSYVLAHQRPNGKERDKFYVEMNATLVAFVIGEKEPDVVGIIEKFCAPDKASRRKEHDGRKLLQVGEYLYEVVNGAYYDRLMRDMERTEENRKRMAKWREKKAKKGKPSPGETAYVKALENGASEAELDRIVDRPEKT
jgi:hypothetical protein